MGIYQKKPIVIEAKQYTGKNREEIFKFTRSGSRMVSSTTKGKQIAIHTLEGVMFANVGDWIIKGVQGEFYPCKPDIFKKTYDICKQQIE